MIRKRARQQLHRCEECGKFRRHCYQDEHGFICGICRAEEAAFEAELLGYQFAYDTLLRDLENIVAAA